MSDEGFKGRYPGGPRRHSEDDEDRPRRRRPPASVGEMEERAQKAHLRRKQGRRRRRLFMGLVAVFLLATGLGAWMGIQSHRTAEELAGERDRPALPPGTDQDRLFQEMIQLQGQQQRLQQQQQRQPPIPDPPPGAGDPRNR